MSAVGTGVMLEQPGVDALLVEPVSTGDDAQLLQGENATGPVSPTSPVLLSRSVSTETTGQGDWNRPVTSII